MNTLICVHAMLLEFPRSISFNRLGTHSIESIFGMTHTIVRGDIGWEKVVSSIAKASIAASTCTAYTLRHPKRRFWNPCGMKIDESTRLSSCCLETASMPQLYHEFAEGAHGGTFNWGSADRQLQPFVERLIWVSLDLKNLGEIEAIRKRGVMSAVIIPYRFRPSRPGTTFYIYDVEPPRRARRGRPHKCPTPPV
jgi:hypothetical protein